MSENYNERPDPVEATESAYIELSQTIKYSDVNEYTLEALESKARYWTDELQNPLRTQKSLDLINRILSYLSFEISARTSELMSLEEVPSTY